MIKKYPDHNIMLDELVKLLLSHWSRKEVIEKVNNLSLGPLKNSSNFFDQDRYHSSIDGRNEKRSLKPKQKLTPTDLAGRIKVPSQKKELLLLIATQFQDRKFLPSVGDIRNFLQMQGRDISKIKSRSESFRLILDVLKDMQISDLTKMLEYNNYSGLSELGPLSDAIRSSKRFSDKS